MLDCQRDLFDIPDEVCYLNCAYISPMLTATRRAIEQGLHRESQPWRIRSDDFFDDAERVRELFARLLRAAHDDVALIPSASYGISIAASNCALQPGQEIVLLQDQYPSNVYAWERAAAEHGARVRRCPRPVDGDWTAGVQEAITRATAVVAVPHCHWMDGALINLDGVAARARAVGAALVIDASQSLGVMPLYIDEIRPDFLITAGYKWMLCPYTVSFMYVAPHRQEGRPLEENALNRVNGRDFPRLHQITAAYAPGARRFDMGERAHFTLLPGALAALQQIDAWGVADICATLGALTARLSEAVSQMGIAVLPAESRAGHFVGLRFARGVPDGLAAALEDEQVHVSRRGESIRVTPHLYNDAADIDRLLGVLARFV